jgi:L-alanine-DL-glutamate epimerase-like enolase superfamily enzyme
MPPLTGQKLTLPWQKPTLHWQKLTLHLRNPFHLSCGTTDTRDAFWLRLNGDEGWGEGTIPPYYRVDDSAILACWQRANQAERPLPESLEEISTSTPDGPAPARCAIELALLDRIGKRRGVPLHALLGLPRPAPTPTSFTISIDTPDAMAALAAQIAAYPLIKLKLGSNDDEARVKAVRQARPDVRLIVDANAGWDFETARANLIWLKKYRIELIEQPLARDQHAALGALQKLTAIPIVADESVQTIADVEKLGAAGAGGINVKLMKVGGIMPALAMIRRAREFNMRIMLGCMIETSIGITAMAHLASLADWLDLDAPLLIRDDPFDGVRIDAGAKLHLPARPGIGIIRKSENPA